METRAHYVAVGAFVLAMVTIAFVTVLWLARSQLTTQYAHYDVFFTGPVTGLRTGAVVEYSGVPVGKVTDVEIDPANVERIRVTLEIDYSVVIKVDARASVETNILSGVSFIQIVGGTKDAKVLTAHDGERYPVINAHRSRLASVTARAPELLDKLIDTADRVNGLLNEKNRQAFSESLDNFQVFTSSLADRSKDLAEIAAKANATAGALADLAEKIDHSYSGREGLGNQLTTTIGDFDKAAKSLTETSRQLQITLHEVQPGVRTFSTQTVNDIGSLVAQAQTLITGLTRVTGEIEHNPSQFLFGDRREGYRPR